MYFLLEIQEKSSILEKKDQRCSSLICLMANFDLIIVYTIENWFTDVSRREIRSICLIENKEKLWILSRIFFCFVSENLSFVYRRCTNTQAKLTDVEDIIEQRCSMAMKMLCKTPIKINRLRLCTIYDIINVLLSFDPFEIQRCTIR